MKRVVSSTATHDKIPIGNSNGEKKKGFKSARSSRHASSAAVALNTIKQSKLAVASGWMVTDSAPQTNSHASRVSEDPMTSQAK